MLMLKELRSKSDQLAKGLQRSQDLTTFVSIYFIFHFIYIFFFCFSFNILPLCDYTYIIVVFRYLFGTSTLRQQAKTPNFKLKKIK